MKSITFVTLLALVSFAYSDEDIKPEQVVMTERNQFVPYKKYKKDGKDAFVCVVYVRTTNSDEKSMNEVFRQKINDAMSEADAQLTAQSKTGAGSDNPAKTVAEEPKKKSETPVISEEVSKDIGNETQPKDNSQIKQRLLDETKTPSDSTAIANNIPSTKLGHTNLPSIMIECTMPNNTNEPTVRNFGGICKSERLSLSYKPANSNIPYESCIPFGKKDEMLLFVTDLIGKSDKNSVDFKTDSCVLIVASANVIGFMAAIVLVIVNMW